MNDAKSFFCCATSLGDYPLGSSVSHVKKLMEEEFGAEFLAKRLPLYDWSRIAFSISQIMDQSKTILDVGTGNGQTINALAHSGRFERVVGVDIQDYSLFRQYSAGFERRFTDAVEMPFADAEFDTVLCLEVIEHQPGDKLEQVLKEVRRVAKSQLLVSVPFLEPLPLPKYHLQRFTPERVRQLFPDASLSLLLKEPVTKVPWLVIDERYPGADDHGDRSV